MKPKYNFLKNSSYAINGFIEMLKTETSFKIELLITPLIIIIIYFINFTSQETIFIFSSWFFVLIAETINSAIERVVDMITQNYDELAGKAKDIGSFIVFLSILNFIIVFIYFLFFGG